MITKDKGSGLGLVGRAGSTHKGASESPSRVRGMPSQGYPEGGHPERLLFQAKTAARMPCAESWMLRLHNDLTASTSLHARTTPWSQQGGFSITFTRGAESRQYLETSSDLPKTTGLAGQDLDEMPSFRISSQGLSPSVWHKANTTKKDN